MILRNPNHIRINPVEGPAYSAGEMEEPTSETHGAHVHPSDRIASQAKLRAFVRRKGKGKLTYQIGDSQIAPCHQASLVDISENGLGMIAKQVLEVGTQLRISLETPHRGQLVSVLAQVRWMTALAENQFRVGCNLERRLAYTEMQNFLADMPGLSA
jgi:hypothetical protein